MVPFSSDSLARPTQREAVHLPDTIDIARAAQESFETHLRDSASSRSTDRAEAEERDDAEQASRTTNATPPEEARPPEREASEREAAASSGGEAREEDSSVAAENDEPDSVEQDEDGSSDTVVVAAAIVQQQTDETLESSEDETDIADVDATDESDAEADDTARRGARLTNRDLEMPADSDPTDIETTKGASENASSDDSSQARLGNIDGTQSPADVAQPEDQHARELLATAESQANAAAAENSERADAKPEPDAAEARRIHEAAAAVSAAAQGGETDSQGEEAAQQRRRSLDSSAIQKTDNARPESGAVPDHAASRFAQHLTPRGSERSEQALQITEADHRRFVDRVARALPTAEGRGGTLRLRLSPPELGALRLEVTLQNGVLTAKVEAETPLARSLLLDNLPVLRERLEDQGVRVDQFDVDLPRPPCE